MEDRCYSAINALTAATSAAPNLAGSVATAGLPSVGEQADCAGSVCRSADRRSRPGKPARGPGPRAVDGLMTGSGVDVHQAMIATQKASMAFELALAVRNKAVQAYQQVIGMQF